MTDQAAEDYLEAILISLEERGHAKTKEIAEDLGIKAPSVTEMFKRLKEKGLIDYRKYQGATLTDRGREIARSVRSSHQILRDFFEYLQVPQDLADRDACRVEHNLSKDTANQLRRFVRFLEGSPEGEPDWIEDFRDYCSSGRVPKEVEKAEGSDGEEK